MGRVLLVGWLVALHVCDPSEKLCSQANSSKTVMINIQQKSFLVAQMQVLSCGILRAEGVTNQLIFL